jgi:hypothetical protein
MSNRTELINLSIAIKQAKTLDEIKDLASKAIDTIEQLLRSLETLITAFGLTGENNG